MSIKISEINNTKNINFQADKKVKSENKVSEPDNKESFFERNKTALIALGTIGLVAAGLAIRHRILKVNSEELKQSKEANRQVSNFTDKLREHRNKKEDASETIKSFFANASDKAKYKGVGQILTSYQTHINENSWESIFDATLSIKPTKEIKAGKILSKANELIEKMIKNDVMSENIIDKILYKISDRADITKLNILQTLGDAHSVHFIDNKQANFSKHQAKRIIDMLDNIKESEFKYHQTELWTNNKKIEGLRFKYTEKYLEKFDNINSDSINEIKNILSKEDFTDETKLAIINKIATHHIISPSRDEIKLAKILLDNIKNNKAHKSINPDNIYDTMGKFDIGHRIMKFIYNNDKEHNIISLDEKIEFAKHIKSLSTTAKIHTNSFNINSEINEIRKFVIDLKTQNFYKNMSNSDLDDIDRFANDIMRDYDEAFNRYEPDIYIAMEQTNLKLKFEDLISKIEDRCRFFNDDIRANNIKNKLREFKQQKMNTSHYQDSSNRRTHNSWHNVVYSDNVQNAKAYLAGLCEKDETLRDLKSSFEGNSNIDEQAIKTFQRKIALKYHPDRASEDKKAEFEIIFKEANNAINELK